MRNRWKVFVACTATVMIQGLDVVMVNLALPSIGDRLSAELADLQWVVTATALALVSLLPMGGAFGDLYGRRRVLLVGYGFLMAGAVMGWSATSMGLLLTARVAQGVGMALGFPNSLAMVVLAFPQEARGRAVAVWAVLSSTMFAISPVVGGSLVAAFGFNAIFVPVFGIAVVGAIATATWMPRDRPIRERALDVRGIALGTGALSLLSYALIEGGRGGFGRAVIVIVLAVGLWCAGWFVRHELRVAHPMLDLRLIRRASIGPILLVTFVLYAATNAVIFLMAIYLQALRGLSPWTAGLVMAAFSTAVLAGAPVGGYLQYRVGFRRPAVTVLPVLAVATFILGQAGPSTHMAGYVAIGLALVGLLNGVFFVISSSTAVSRAPEEQSSSAAASLPAARQLGGVFGVTLSGTLATIVTRARLRSVLPETDEIAEHISNISFGVVPEGVDRVVAAASSEAAYFGYAMVMIAISVCAVVLAWVALRLLPPEPTGGALPSIAGPRDGTGRCSEQEGSRSRVVSGTDPVEPERLGSADPASDGRVDFYVAGGRGRSRDGFGDRRATCAHRPPGGLHGPRGGR